ncbi:MAG: hypothetical protein EXS30_09310 [Pedosphaera sp.]|nr:hypothetical protein [Pedosphaera sp.]
MKAKIILTVGLIVVIGWASASMVSVWRQPVHQPSPHAVRSERRGDAERANNPVRPVATSIVDPVGEERLNPEPTATSSSSMQRTDLVKRQDQADVGTSKAPKALAQPDQNAHFSDPAVKQQIGRIALSLVGLDADADQVWLWAINDRSLSANTRKDLIEDLNEDGFPDPKNPTMDDMPLIENRIELIEEFAGNAMDDVNFAAFQEAYKDLVNMWLRLAQQ